MRVWESMSLIEQVRESLGAFGGLHRMQVSPDWPSVRTRAALEAERRVRQYETERAQRLEAYARGGAREAYQKQWRRHRSVVAIHDESAWRFTRAVGGEW